MEGMNSLITVKQLPIIEQQLRAVKEEIRARTEGALSLECTNDTVKEIKKLRADLNKDLMEFEERRKAVKKAVMAPYEEFEVLYKECISDQYKEADKQLKERINTVEAGIILKKQNEVIAYYDEYAQSLGLEWVPYEYGIPNITLSASLKKLKEAVKAFLDQTSADVELIKSQEYADEIMIEYKKTLNLNSSMLTVQNRHKELEAMQARKEAEKAAQEAAEKAVEKVDEVLKEEPLKPPIAVPETDTNEAASLEFIKMTPVFRTTFTITATYEKLKDLKAFLNEGGYTYECK